ncbi:MAG: tetratricopeptide repeat protein [Bacteroidales bacterium]
MKILLSAFCLVVALSKPFAGYTQTQSDSLIELARDYMLMSDHEAAIEQLDKILDREQTHPLATALKAEILILQNDSKKAGKLVSKALKDYPDTPELLYLDGKLDLQKGRIGRAIEQLSAALAKEQGNKNLQSDIFLNRGAAYQKNLESDKALDDYSKAIELDPDNPNVYIYRGTLYFGNEDYTLAIEDFEKVILLDPNNPSAYYNLGMAYLKLEDTDKACKNFHKGCELGNKNACRMVIMNCVELNKR